MSSLERRFPRENFTKKLSRMCQRLDEASDRPIEYRSCAGMMLKTHIYVSALWVVGSYARGSMDCGDLDLVMEITTVGAGAPMPSKVSNLMLGSYQNVRCYNGTPQNNNSGVEFPDSVLVWSGGGCDWKRAIDEIAIDPLAGRAPRASDCIPFRQEQLREYSDGLEYMARLINEHRINARFVPYDVEMLNPNLDELAERNVGFMYMLDHVGSKSRLLLPALWRVMQSYEPRSLWLSTGITDIVCGNSRIIMGRPALDVDWLSRDPQNKRLVIAPHLSARGPNGAWILTRGIHHGTPLPLNDERLPSPWGS